ncbi:hypothetical protein [Nocardia transvalensis]|uniref:hypothetical protein n=1 Tax=Nocardia transvalensis TaxID=37333 RepID=UPI0018961D8A|nr:hypothetical protein [Nocardia transvalensis]MBF6333453.1 hypothetical protein [Nocardia transvalensis]
MSDLGPNDHPVLFWATVAAGLAGAVSLIWARLAPAGSFFWNLRVKLIQRRQQIEAEAAALNDQRNEMLIAQISALKEQVDDLLRELTRTQKDLAEARTEIMALRAQLSR